MRSKKVKFEVGNLVFLKTKIEAKPPFPARTTEEVGVGTILEKITELFVLYEEDKPIEEINYHYDSDVETALKESNQIKADKKTNKRSIKTNICKVFWHKIRKTKWEYESDLVLQSEM